MVTDVSLADEVASVLLEEHRFTIYHVSTPPTRCPAIFSPAPGSKAEKTLCEKHMLAVTGRTSDGAVDEIITFAIEAFIYTTSQLTTIFVSKADSTGYLSLLNLPKIGISHTKGIASIFVSWLVKNHLRPRTRLVVSLFARAQDQYLFPGSVENTSKHVIDDRGLIKWWCRVLDPILRRYQPAYGDDLAGRDETVSKGYLTVPGFDSHETSAFYPLPPSPTHCI